MNKLLAAASPKSSVQCQRLCEFIGIRRGVQSVGAAAGGAGSRLCVRVGAGSSLLCSAALC